MPVVSFSEGVRAVGRSQDLHKARQPPFFTKGKETDRAAGFQTTESSFKGHTVDALVPTGDEGRDKLR